MAARAAVVQGVAAPAAEDLAAVLAAEVRGVVVLAAGARAAAVRAAEVLPALYCVTCIGCDLSGKLMSSFLLGLAKFTPAA